MSKMDMDLWNRALITVKLVEFIVAFLYVPLQTRGLLTIIMTE